MRILDLFAGIGGFSLAAHWMGWETAAFVEWEEKAQCRLKKNFPGVPVYGDIKEFHYEKEKHGPIDLICGGFPCQPFSSAENRKGKDDDRHLWPQMLRVIREVKPAFVLAENVAGIVSMDSGKVLEEICTDLESEGYAVQPFIIPAISKGAPHRRDRIWIVAHSDSGNARVRQRTLQKSDERKGVQQEQRVGQCGGTNQTFRQDFTNTKKAKCQFTCDTWERGVGFADLYFNPTNPGGKRLQRSEQPKAFRQKEGTPRSTPERNKDDWYNHWLEIATELCRVDDGLPHWMDSSERKTIYNAVGYFGRKETEKRTGLDLRKVEEQVQRTEKLKQLGNSIVPQVVYEIFKAIELN
jgi:DNA-cytosine methyltransferase